MPNICSLLRPSSVLWLSLGLLHVINAKTLNLENDDEFLVDTYMKTELEVVTSFYFFNLTNPEEFINGETPIFNEVGPYAYKTVLKKDNLKWVNSSLIEYTKKDMYRYFPKKSKGNRQFDKITTINVPLITALHSMKNTDKRAQKTIASFVEILGQKPYVTHTVRELLWGYDNQLISFGKTIQDAGVFPEAKAYPYDKFGLFVGKNHTNIGTARVASGLDGIGYLGEIKAWKEPNKSAFSENLDIWRKGSQCDTARGSDGFVFPKNIQKDETIWVFNRHFCRSLALTYQNEITDSNGISGYRFVAARDIFETVDNNPANGCFCDKRSQLCSPYSGLLNISKCAFGAPMLVSWPHFFEADKVLLNDVEGLNPDSEKHQTYYDISKNDGVPLRGRVNAQVNIVIDDYEDIKQVQGLKPMVFPIMWSSTESDGIKEPEVIARFKAINI